MDPTRRLVSQRIPDHGGPPAISHLNALILSSTERSALVLPADSRIAISWMKCCEHSTAQFSNLTRFRKG